jgi:hypothetical protein
MEPGGSLPHSQVPSTCHYPEPARSVYTPHPTFWRSILMLSSYLWLGLPSGIFPLGFFFFFLYMLIFSPHTLYMPCPSHSYQFYHPNSIGWGVIAMQLKVLQWNSVHNKPNTFWLCDSSISSACPFPSYCSWVGTDWNIQLKIHISMNLQLKKVIQKFLQHNEGHLPLSHIALTREMNVCIRSFPLPLTAYEEICHSTQISQHHHKTYQHHYKSGT